MKRGRLCSANWLTPNIEELLLVRQPCHLDSLISFIIINHFKNTLEILKKGIDCDLYFECGPAKKPNDFLRVPFVIWCVLTEILLLKTTVLLGSTQKEYQGLCLDKNMGTCFPISPLFRKEILLECGKERSLNI